jgi:hypothetical protein
MRYVLLDTNDELSPAQVADDVRAALMEYSAGHVYEISDASDLARLIRDADDDFEHS